MLGDTLDRARRIITGVRQENYGAPGENLAIIAEMWSSYLTARIRKPVELDGRDVCNLMSILKISRDAFVRIEDNPTDVCGYQSIAGDVFK